MGFGMVALGAPLPQPAPLTPRKQQQQQNYEIHDHVETETSGGYSVQKLSKTPLGFNDNVAAVDKKSVSDSILTVLVAVQNLSQNPRQELILESIEVRATGVTHYTVIIVSSTANYTDELLASILYESESGSLRYGLKDAYIDPRVNCANLEVYATANRPQEQYVPALIVELWTVVEAQRRATVLVQSGTAQHQAPNTPRPSSVRGFGSYVLAAGTELTSAQRLPHMAVRVLEYAPITRVTAGGGISQHAQRQIDALCGMLYALHRTSPDASTWDTPAEFNCDSDRTANTCVVTALGYTNRITLSDMLALRLCDAQAVCGVSFNCALACITPTLRSYPRGGVAIRYRFQQEQTSVAPDGTEGVHIFGLLRSPQDRAASVTRSFFSRVLETTPAAQSSSALRSAKRSAVAAELDAAAGALPLAPPPSPAPPTLVPAVVVMPPAAAAPEVDAEAPRAKVARVVPSDRMEDSAPAPQQQSAPPAVNRPFVARSINRKEQRLGGVWGFVRSLVGK